MNNCQPRIDVAVKQRKFSNLNSKFESNRVNFFDLSSLNHKFLKVLRFTSESPLIISEVRYIFVIVQYYKNFDCTPVLYFLLSSTLTRHHFVPLHKIGGLCSLLFSISFLPISFWMYNCRRLRGPPLGRRQSGPIKRRAY